jgi:putative endonuclease
MNYYVYVIQSLSNKKYYIGQTGGLKRRLNQHNLGLARSTKSGIPWKLVLTEKFESRIDAVRRERQIKTYKSGEAFKKLIRKVAREA